ncbi:MAG: hypothetical protein FD133_354 [Erysipelotrichaceae bacterium]|nr:MAG: hypothetical protein FD133_354 [Erysipelotrichaceae bacterium]
MNNQSLEVLNFLLLKTDWTTSSEITNICGGSIRLLRNVVKNINSKQLILESSSKGYRISNEYRDYVREVIKDIHNQASSDQNSQNSRIQYIINKFLTSRNKLDYFSLAEELYISESTLNTELVSLRKTLEKYELTLYKQKEFLYLSGNEKNIRRLAKDTIYSEVKDGLLNLKILGQTFRDYNVNKIRTILSTLILQENLYINDFGLLDLVLHLCIAMDRIRNKQSYQTETVVQSSSYIEEPAGYSIAIKMTDEINKLYGIQFNKKEIQEFSLLLLINVKEFEVNNLSLDALKKNIPDSTIGYVYSIIQKVYDNYFVDLNNADFVIRFSLHLDQLLKSHRRIINPLFTSIKHSYPLVFDISVFISDLIVNEYRIKLDNHDISFIALHVGISIENNYKYKIPCIVLFPNYYNLKQHILNNINSNFGNYLDILSTYSDESQIDLKQKFELILSTSPLSNSYGIETLVISPFVNELDHSNILREIHIIQKKQYKTEASDLVLLFRPQNFTIYDNKLTRNEIIR